MKRPVRTLAGFLGAAVLVLVAVLVGRAWLAGQPQPEPATLSGVALHGDAAVARLSRAIRFRTISHAETARNDPAPFRAFAAWLREAFPRVDASLRRETVGEHSLLYTWPGRQGEQPGVLLTAHLDVVPVDPATEHDWRHPPYSGAVADGHVWGRGALDDKSSVLAIMEAAEALLARGFRPERTFYLAFGHDEEIGGGAGAARIARTLADRGVRLAYVLDEGSAILEGVLPVAAPVAGIGVAEKGFVSLELAAEGAGGHSSMPPAMTAAGRVARAVHRVQSEPFPARLAPPSRATLSHLAPHAPLANRLVLSNLWLFEPLVLSQFTGSPTTAAAVRTTTAPTMLSGAPKDNILPERASAVVNFRLLQGDTMESVASRVTELVDDPAVTISRHGGFGQDPSPMSSVDSAAYRSIAAAALALGNDIIAVPMQVVGATDSRHYQSLAGDVYRFLPVTLTPELIDSIHGTDERIPVEGYLGMIRFYATLMEQPLAVD